MTDDRSVNPNGDQGMPSSATPVDPYAAPAADPYAQSPTDPYGQSPVDPYASGQQYGQQSESGAPQYGAPDAGQQPYGAPDAQYGQQPQPYGAPDAQYGQQAQPYGAPQYGAPQYGAPQYGAQPYGAPQYGAPPYGAPQYGQQPQQYAYGYAAQPSGRTPWALTFLLCIPYIGWIAAGIVSITQVFSARKTGSPLVLGNANAAANFVLSTILYFFATFALFFIGAAITSSAGDDTAALFLLPSLLMFAIGIWSLVMMIMGTVKSGTEVFRAVPVIPFFRD